MWCREKHPFKPCHMSIWGTLLDPTKRKENRKSNLNVIFFVCLYIHSSKTCSCPIKYIGVDKRNRYTRRHTAQMDPTIWNQFLSGTVARCPTPQTNIHPRKVHCYPACQFADYLSKQQFSCRALKKRIKKYLHMSLWSNNTLVCPLLINIAANNTLSVQDVEATEQVCLLCL